MLVSLYAVPVFAVAAAFFAAHFDPASRNWVWGLFR